MGNKERRAALLKQQFDMMEQVQEIDSRLLEDAKPKWNPEGGNWWITSNSDIVPATTSINCEQATLFGTRRPTKEQAEKAATAMRKFNRLLALRDYFCGEVDVDWNNCEEAYYVNYFHALDTWAVGIEDDKIEHVSAVYFPTRAIAQKVCDMLIRGEVEL